MNTTTHSAIFESTDAAHNAITALRDAGIPDTAISVIGRDGTPMQADSVKGDDRILDTDGDERLTTDGEARTMRGVLGGGALGALLGVVAVALPGPGTVFAAGAIAAAGTGFILGGALGGLGELLTQHGVAPDDVAFYEERIGQGGIFLSVRDDAVVDASRVDDILAMNGGHRAAGRMATAGDPSLA